METSPVAGGVSGTGQDSRQETHHEHAAIFGLNRATANGRESLALGLLFGLGLLLGLAVAPVIADYANADPSALWQAAGATAAFVAAFGAYGYATRRDLSAWERPLFWALLGLIVFGIVAIFVSIPGGHIIYAVAGPGTSAPARRTWLRQHVTRRVPAPGLPLSVVGTNYTRKRDDLPERAGRRSVAGARSCAEALYRW